MSETCKNTINSAFCKYPLTVLLPPWTQIRNTCMQTVSVFLFELPLNYPHNVSFVYCVVDFAFLAGNSDGRCLEKQRSQTNCCCCRAWESNPKKWHNFVRSLKHKTSGIRICINYAWLVCCRFDNKVDVLIMNAWIRNRSNLLLFWQGLGPFLRYGIAYSSARYTCLILTGFGIFLGNSYHISCPRIR